MDPSNSSAADQADCEPNDHTDPFDSLLNLEETYYARGYSLGHADGIAQASLEARVFGIEKGFEKFVAMGKLRRRAELWASRIGLQWHDSAPKASDATKPSVIQRSGEVGEEELEDGDHATAPTRQNANERLVRHITTMLLLTDPATLSTVNAEDEVAEFDDRLKRARAKAKVIERLVGGRDFTAPAQDNTAPTTADEGAATQDIESLKVRMPKKT